MVFETLHEAAQSGELILVDGGMCRYHRRRDGQITIREILVLPDRQRQGIGRAMLDMLKDIEGAVCIVARCPGDLPAGRWYEHMGFRHTDSLHLPSGRFLDTWRLDL